jgi:hypothetical protein
MHEDTVTVDDTFAVASGALPEATCDTVALENPPPVDRCQEVIQQAAQLASWEDEGGTTSR